jgi:ribose/xylose/arabinose/galactoside ABC-type transport system permease subunit
MKSIEQDSADKSPLIFQARKLIYRENTIRLVVFLMLVATFALATGGATASRANISNVLVQSAIRGVAACGQALVILTGGLDLSVSGAVALTLMIGGTMITGNPKFQILGAALSPFLVMPIMLLIGTSFGFVNGVIISRFHLPSLIVTLGTWQIGYGIAYQVTKGGFVDKIPESIAFVGQDTSFFIPIPILIFFAVVCVSYFLLHHTPLGAEIYAVGGNARAAAISGVRVQRIRLAVFAIAGLLYGVGAVLAMSRYLTATLQQAGGLELATIAAVAVGGVSLSGGRGTMIGVLLGTLIIAVVDNALSVMGVGPGYAAILKGMIIVAAVAADGLRRS